MVGSTYIGAAHVCNIVWCIGSSNRWCTLPPLLLLLFLLHHQQQQHLLLLPCPAASYRQPSSCSPWPCTYINVNVNNLLAMSESDFDNSGEPGPQAEEVNHLETPLRQLHVTHRAFSSAKRSGHVQLCSKPRGGTRNRSRDPQKKGSAFITPSVLHMHAMYACIHGSLTDFVVCPCAACDHVSALCHCHTSFNSRANM